ncbi:hypothetical protein, partial [Actinomyces oricola]|uniref:hypothetical protein n=1 Tax=Actinomyces oricola TaxID=206043 RepID=UPI0013E8D8AB
RNAGLFKRYPSSPRQATPQPPHPQNPPSPQASPTTNDFAEPLIDSLTSISSNLDKIVSVMRETDQNLANQIRA